jgi:cellobiose phosphorylase
MIETAQLDNPQLTKNPYGYYDGENHEYVITRPDTPTPWINYLGEGEYGGIISNTAGGFSFDRDPRNRRITRYRYNGIPTDQPGRYIYLHDRESGEYWSPTWQPVINKKLDRYECRHGAAYTSIRGDMNKISTEILYFVPPKVVFGGCACELWVVKIKNIDTRSRYIRSFSYVEFSFLDAIIDQQNFDWGGHIVYSRFIEGLICAETKFRPTITYFSSNQSPVGFDTDREMFLGKYRDLSNPIAVVQGKSFNSESPRGNSIGSLSHDWELDPGEEKEIVFILGCSDQAISLSSVLDFFSNPINVQNAFVELKRNWNEYLSMFTVDTPDEDMNAMLNFWNPVQCRTTLYWSRFVSGYESGLGRGMGTRDSAQDSLATVHSVPETVTQVLLKLWNLQFKDGHTWHQFFPLTGEGGPGHAVEYPNWPQWFSDDHLWLIIAVCAYLRETGDFSFLKRRIAYWDGDDPEDTIFGHMIRAIQFTLNNRGPRGLPRLGFSDWDDTMNMDHGSGKAESVWCGEFFCRACLDFCDLCEFLENKEVARFLRETHSEMAETIQRTSWDGKWYARAFDDDGKPVGVECDEIHKINMIPQAWAVIGEIGNPERIAQAMESMHEKLNTPYGIATLCPPYNGSDPRVRGTSTYPPGAKENGGIFCHANAWAIVAAAKMGLGDRAYQYYRQILPITRHDADIFLVEPYVYCQNICGPFHPQFGRGRNAWLTGTASWTYVGGSQWILGIRPTFWGLEIDPVIPENWDGFTAVRIYRGVKYNITVKRCKESIETEIVVNGVKNKGKIVPIPTFGTTEVIVEVYLV